MKPLQRIIRTFKSLFRGYQGAAANRIHPDRPKNQSADRRSLGPEGADTIRAWARKLVQDDPLAKSVVDSIVASVIGTGISVESLYEPDGPHVAASVDINETRQKKFDQWCKVCELTGRYDFHELQDVIQREITEAGEVLVHYVTVPLEYKGVKRPVPLAIELIEADRLATDYDTYGNREGENRIVRGVELDDEGFAVAYWIYPQHPLDAFSFQRIPERIPADRIEHLFRKDRIGQTRGLSWLTPVISILRNLNTYVENELQASAISSCDMTVVRSDNELTGPNPGGDNPAVDENGNRMEYYEPGRIWYVGTADDVTHINPARPNSGSEPWINLMVHQVASGTSTAYQSISKDVSKANYSNSRMSRLDIKPHIQKWQHYLVRHLCEPTWSRFMYAAAAIGLDAFPSTTQLDEDFDYYAAAEWHPPMLEYVDPDVEQKSSENAIKACQSTYQIEIGKRSGNYKRVFRQAAKERQERKAMGLLSVEEMKAEAELMKAEAALLTAKAAQQNADTNAQEATSVETA